jgi:hypothetical protein
VSFFFFFNSQKKYYETEIGQPLRLSFPHFQLALRTYFLGRLGSCMHVPLHRVKSLWGRPNEIQEQHMREYVDKKVKIICIFTN